MQSNQIYDCSYKNKMSAANTNKDKLRNIMKNTR